MISLCWQVIDPGEENDGVELWESDEDGEDSMQQNEDQNEGAFPGIVFFLTWM